MKILLYVNKGKDKNLIYTNEIIRIIQAHGAVCDIICDEDLNKRVTADALFVYGGDGTVLWVAEFASKNSIPIITINAGKLGYLSEFESFEIETAIKSFIDNKLVLDKRIALTVECNSVKYFALNDAVVQRGVAQTDHSFIANLGINIDGKFLDKIVGDGAIISTPTGSTAYSLSAGGAILAPGIDAFSMTPISAHSLHHRPIVYSSKSICIIENIGDDDVSLYVDGKFIQNVCAGGVIKVEKAELPVTFLRKKDYNFYDRLVKKLNHAIKA